MHGENTEILTEVYKASEMGLAATEILLPKVQDAKMRRQIQSQRQTYVSTAGKAARMLQKKGAAPDAGKRPVQKAMLWGSIQMNTLADSSSQHIAEMMIQGTTMGIVDLQKRLNELPKADSDSRRIAENFLKDQQQTIDELKHLL
ncbi:MULTISPECIES: hypothetical protein [Caproicibacterium]|uniref:DUF2383 domain-containing protein n=1 Tax=Caproicibacterium argilliputei TaxID=3030016 RepID=A0AA97H375_9FIRM|nr:hypothetical protein [Caproicibacterium argilliputei]WOC33540.1 hypothetical protein PXC00_06645 [Caproicibacterium argilliputei]